MIIGIDFDNTIVCYDEVFAQLATRSGAKSKAAFQSLLRSNAEGEWEWTLAQGQAYGPGLTQAQPYSGFIETASQLLTAGHQIRIISHKTRYPTAGDTHDLHAAARSWINNQLALLIELGFDPVQHVRLEPDLEAKLQAIKSEQCDFFIDDLESILAAPDFPVETNPIWFKPDHRPSRSCFPVLADWTKLPTILPSVSSPPKPAYLSHNRPSETKRLQQLASESGYTFNHWQAIKGGVNSTVFRVTLSNGTLALAKLYPDDKRQRRAREQRFLEILNSAGIARVPKLLGSSVSADAILIEFLDGHHPSTESPVPSIIWESFLNFISEIQSAAKAPLPTSIPRSEEGCLSLQQHIAKVAKRRDRWLARSERQSSELETWIRTDLERSFQTLAKRTICNPSFKEPIPQSSLILSPSDFGAHNALVHKNTVSFVDFEYAGWDDPAKLFADFFCQPRHPAPKTLKPKWVQTLENLLPPDQRYAFRARLHEVESCIALKWIYIILDRQATLDASGSWAIPELVFDDLRERVTAIALPANR